MRGLDLRDQRAVLVHNRIGLVPPIAAGPVRLAFDRMDR